MVQKTFLNRNVGKTSVELEEGFMLSTTLRRSFNDIGEKFSRIEGRVGSKAEEETWGFMLALILLTFPIKKDKKFSQSSLD